MNAPLQRPSRGRRGLLSAALGLAAGAALALPTTAQTAAVEMRSLLDAFRVYQDGPTLDSGGTFYLDRFWTAFLPDACLYDNGDLVKGQNQCWAVLRRAGETTELGRWSLLAEKGPAVFTSLRVVGKPIEHHFDAAGDYTLSIQVDDEPFGVLPFTIEFRDSDDPFNPARKTYVTGRAYERLAALQLSDTSDPDGSPTVRLWMRGGTFNPSGGLEELQLTIEQDGLVVFTTTPATRRAIDHDSVWRKHEYTLKFPEGQGGGVVRTRNLLSNDGTYQMLLKRDGQLDRAWEFTVSGGKVVPIDRQQLKHQPHFDYLVPRSPGDDRRKALDLFWMESLAPDLAAAAASAGPGSVGGPSEAERAAWIVAATPPAAGFEVTVTSVPARMDGGLAVGPEVIAFGTGSTRGVSWMRVGETEERTIPGGQDASNDVFAVCGSKIVLTKRNQVSVFDTATGSTYDVPTEEVYLWRAVGGQYEANFLRADGFLVATLNDPTKVSDRAQVKVLDVSGPTPRIHTLHGPDFPPGDVSSIAVDAASGRVAFGSQKHKAIFHAPVSDGARFTKFDLSGHDGFGRTCQLKLEGPRAIYFDEAGAQKLRLADLDAQQIGVAGLLVSERAYYDLEGGQLAFASDQRSAVALGAFGQTLNYPAGTGEDGLGLGQAIAIHGGLVFVAGDGKSGIGSGEKLYVGDASGWRGVRTAEGALLPAVDVVAAPGVVAFKTGRANDTRVAYARVGSSTALDAIAPAQ